MNKLHKKLLYIGIFGMLLFLAGCSGNSRSGTISQSRYGSGNKVIVAEEGTEAVELSAETAENRTDSGIYIIKQMDMANEVIGLIQVSNQRQQQIGYTMSTRFLDKYGNTASVSSFTPGAAVNIEVDKATSKLLALQMSDDVWVYDNIVRYTVDGEKGIFTTAGTDYKIDAETTIYSGNEEVTLESIGAEDELRAVGIDKKILSLTITTGHGFLYLKNTKLFEGSIICVGSKIFSEVTKDMKLEVPEGIYVVTVANDGYGGSKEVQIERNADLVLDLDELKGEGPKICNLTFEVGTENAMIRIDGKKVDYAEPIEVRYGTHALEISADGYETLSKKLVVNSKEATIEIGLTEESAETDSDTNTSSGSTGTASGGTSSGTANRDNTTNGSTSSENSTTGSSALDGISTVLGNTGNNGTTDTASGSASTGTSQSDYLTTLYNLLTERNMNNSEEGE